MVIAIAIYFALGIAVSAGIAVRYRNADIPKEELYPALLIHLMVIFIWPLCIRTELRVKSAARKQAKARKAARARMNSVN